MTETKSSVSLDCGNCQLQFSFTNPAYYMGCGEIACGVCLSQLLKTSKRRCPYSPDHELHPKALATLEDFPLAYDIMVAIARESSSTDCNECPRTSTEPRHAAVRACIQCRSRLCSKMVAFHTKHLSEHTLCDLTSIEQSPTIAGIPHEICPDHALPKAIYCDYPACNILICEGCYPTHSDHITSKTTITPSNELAKVARRLLDGPTVGKLSDLQGFIVDATSRSETSSEPTSLNTALDEVQKMTSVFIEMAKSSTKKAHETGYLEDKERAERMAKVRRSLEYTARALLGTLPQNDKATPTSPVPSSSAVTSPSSLSSSASSTVESTLSTSTSSSSSSSSSSTSPSSPSTAPSTTVTETDNDDVSSSRNEPIVPSTSSLSLASSSSSTSSSSAPITTTTAATSVTTTTTIASSSSAGGYSEALSPSTNESDDSLNIETYLLASSLEDGQDPSSEVDSMGPTEHVGKPASIYTHVNNLRRFMNTFTNASSLIKPKPHLEVALSEAIPTDESRRKAALRLASSAGVEEKVWTDRAAFLMSMLSVASTSAATGVDMKQVVEAGIQGSNTLLENADLKRQLISERAEKERLMLKCEKLMAELDLEKTKASDYKALNLALEQRIAASRKHALASTSRMDAGSSLSTSPLAPSAVPISGAVPPVPAAGTGPALSSVLPTDPLGENVSLIEEKSDQLFPAAYVKYINDIIMSPDGKWLATGDSNSKVTIWDMTGPTPSHPQTFSHNGTVFHIAWSPNSKALISASLDHSASVWVLNDSSSTFELHKNIPYAVDANAVCWSPDGNQFAVGTDDKTAVVYSFPACEPVITLRGHNQPTFSLAWSPCGEFVAGGSHDTSVLIWKVSTGEVVHKLESHTRWVWCVGWSPCGKYFASCSSDKTLVMYSADRFVAKYKVVVIAPTPERARPQRFAWHPSGGTLALTVGNGGVVCLVNAATGAITQYWLEQDGPVASGWSVDGSKLFVSASTVLRIHRVLSGPGCRLGVGNNPSPALLQALSASISASTTPSSTTTTSTTAATSSSATTTTTTTTTTTSAPSTPATTESTSASLIAPSTSSTASTPSDSNSGATASGSSSSSSSST